jgi:5-methylcytosine-specific restriction protein A
MPRRAPSPCREQRCPELVDSSVGYCKQHLRAHKAQAKQRHRKYNKARASNEDERSLQRFYRTASWRNIRAAYITKSPLCELCTLRNRVVVGTVVDHIIERRDGGDDLDMANLQTLCHRCHTVKTNEERSKR